jgi:hypothetical protein
MDYRENCSATLHSSRKPDRKCQGSPTANQRCKRETGDVPDGDRSASVQSTWPPISQYGEKKASFMKRAHPFFVARFAAVCLMFAAGAAIAADIHPKQSANFKNISTLVKLPDYLPGPGVRYVDPSTLRSAHFSVTTRRDNW